jgi:cytoskeletal protein CcmA (bactofilin family)
MHKLKSFLGSQSEIKGELSSKGILRLDGRVVGNIYADQVILSETAFVKGEITAGKIIVGGTIEGILFAEDLVEIRSKGKVTGDILTKRLVVMHGGVFNGQIEMTADMSNVLDFESHKRSQGNR